MTRKHLDAFAAGAADVIKRVVDGPTVAGRLDALEQRIKDLESRPLLKYAGVWKADATYTEGRLATHAGGLWLAIRATTDRPGTPGSGWRLIVKSGHAP